MARDDLTTCIAYPHPGFLTEGELEGVERRMKQTGRAARDELSIRRTLRAVPLAALTQKTRKKENQWRPPKPCDHCGESYTPTRPAQRFCCQTCSSLGTQARRAKQREARAS